MTKIPPAVEELGDIPATALVMGGNWDKRYPDSLLLSPESIMRVRALGVLGMYDKVDTAIFCGGLTRAGVREAAQQHNLFEAEFPGIELHVLEEDKGHTTKWDAEYTAQLVEEVGLTNPFTLVTSKDYIKRQTRVFERRGFEIVPVAAEPLVSTLSSARQTEVRRYMRSAWRVKLAASETVLLGLDYIDPDSKVTEWLAGRLRPNHGFANQ